jgi:hypothetical protein
MQTIRHIDDLLDLQDAAFVEAAYRVLLGRAPDPGGADFYLRRLQSGIEKVRILKELRRSPEGRSRTVRVTGLDVAIRRQERLDSSPLWRLLRELGYGNDRQRAPRMVRLLGAALFPPDAATPIDEPQLPAQTEVPLHAQELVRQLTTLAGGRRNE